jgi:hypothetical protein
LASKRLQRRPGGRTSKSRRLPSPSDTKDSRAHGKTWGPRTHGLHPNRRASPSRGRRTPPPQRSREDEGQAGGDETGARIRGREARRRRTSRKGCRCSPRLLRPQGSPRPAPDEGDEDPPRAARRCSSALVGTNSAAPSSCASVVASSAVPCSSAWRSARRETSLRRGRCRGRVLFVVSLHLVAAV